MNYASGVDDPSPTISLWLPPLARESLFPVSLEPCLDCRDLNDV